MKAATKFSGRKLRQLRLDRGWTQAELADHANIRRERQIIRWENDQNEPRIDAIALLATALGVPIDALFADDASEEVAPSGETFRGGSSTDVRSGNGSGGGASGKAGARGTRATDEEVAA